MPLQSLVHLLDLLKANQLLEPAQWEELDRTLSRQFPDPRKLARELIQRGWLTPYQANQLFQGHGKDLVLGSYVLLERLGEGGMGQVFKARHRKLGRIVALKIIRKERLAKPDVVRRFHREIQAAAQLAHPNVVLAYDADQVGDRHFFAMEYVEGIDLAKLAKQRGPLPPSEACDYIRQAALGLQHAHEAGLVHRDIKPSNLLLTFKTKGCVVKVLDLGLARLRATGDGDSASSLTQEGTMMGTPDYISPEQAMSSHTVDIRSDLYSLGCTFYFLLTGKTPFAGGSLMDKLIKHRLEEPAPVEQLRPDVPPEVGGVVRKLMAKILEERYQTPGELAWELEAICQAFYAGVSSPTAGVAAEGGIAASDGNQPTEPAANAGLETPAEQPAAMPSFLAQAARRVRERERSRRRYLILGVGISAAVFLSAGLLVLALAYLTSETPPTPSPAKQEPPQPQVPVLTVKIEADKAWQDTGLDVQAKVPITIRAKGQWRQDPSAPECSADGDATASVDRNVLWDAPAMCLLGRVGNDEVLVLNKDRTIYPKQTGRLFVQANLLDLDGASGSLTLEIQGAKQNKDSAAAAPLVPTQAADSAYKKLTAEADLALKPLLARATDHKADPKALVTDLLGFRSRYPGTPQAVQAAGLLRQLPSPLDALAPGKLPADAQEEWRASGVVLPKELVGVLGEHRWRHWGHVEMVAFSPNGRLLAAACWDKTAKVVDAATGQVRAVLRNHKEKVDCLAFSPDGRNLATGSYDKTIKLWDVSAKPGEEGFGKELATLTGHTNAIHGLSFSADNKLLASASSDGTARLWDVAAATESATLSGHTGAVFSVAFSPDGKTVASAGADTTVKVWNVTTREASATFTGHRKIVDALAFSPDGKTLASAGQEEIIKLWDPAAGTELASIKAGGGRINWITFSPDGQMLATAHADAHVRLWDVAARKLLVAAAGHARDVRCVAFAPDGKKLASGSADHTVRLWELNLSAEAALPNPGSLVLRPLSGHTAPLQCVAFSPDGRLLASGGLDKTLRLWDPSKTTELRRLDHPGFVRSVAFSPDSRSLLSAGGDDKSIRLWSPEQAAALRSFDGHLTWVQTAIFSADGRRVVSAAPDRTVRVWDFASGKELLRCEGHTGNVAGVAISPDGRLLASAGADGDGTLRLWDAFTGRELRSVPAHANAAVWSVAFSPDGRTVASGGSDNCVRLREIGTDKELLKLTGFTARLTDVGFSPDGNTLAATSVSGQVLWWDAATGQKLGELTLPGVVYGLAFAPDSRHVAIANANGTIYVLRLTPPT